MLTIIYLFSNKSYGEQTKVLVNELMEKVKKVFQALFILMLVGKTG
jgi:hypothetical protein